MIRVVFSVVLMMLLKVFEIQALEIDPSTRIRIAQAKAGEVIRRVDLLKDRVQELKDTIHQIKVKAEDVLGRTSLEERIAIRTISAEVKEVTPKVMATNLDEREIETSQREGMKAVTQADKIIESIPDFLDLLAKARSLAEDVLNQVETAIKDVDLTISQAEAIDTLADEAVAMIREAEDKEKEMSKEIILAADAAAKADYYSRYREKRRIEIDIAEIAEEETRIPLIRTRKLLPAARLEGMIGEYEYTVVKGDCLWFIASRFYGNPFKWPKIYAANKKKIKDPHWIYPGQVFTIPQAE